MEDCGTELNIEVKRKIQKHCVQAPKFLRKALEVYKNEKQTFMWNRKMAQSREGCAIQLDSFAQMIQHATKELDASIFSDEHLEKKIRNRFAKLGIKILTTVFLITEDGRYEIHITTKAKKGECFTTKELAQIISECFGKGRTAGSEFRILHHYLHGRSKISHYSRGVKNWERTSKNVGR